MEWVKRLHVGCDGECCMSHWSLSLSQRGVMGTLNTIFHSGDLVLRYYCRSSSI